MPVVTKPTRRDRDTNSKQEQDMNTRQRLAAYRAKAAKNDSAPFNVWKYWTRSVWSVPSNATGKNGQRFTDTLEQYGKNLGDAHDLHRHINHRGWYADNYQDALIRGAVCKMRSPKGTLYIPATYCTAWDGTIHFIKDAVLVAKGSDEYDHDQAIRQAATYADHYAQKEAEEAREFEAKDQAEQMIAGARAYIHRINELTLELIREIKANENTYTPAVCQALKDSIKHRLNERRGAFEQISKLEGNFWEAVPH